MCNRLWAIGCGLVAVLLLAAPAAVAAEKATVFEMEKVSLLDEQGSVQSSPRSALMLGGGQYARCTFVRNTEVKKYPELKSDRPVYGSVSFGGSPYDPQAGKSYYFVVDESGEAGSGEDKQPQEKSVLRTLGDALGGSSNTAAAADNRTYDRLYFDCNGDLDLTNDPATKPMEDPPPWLGRSTRQTLFDVVSVDFDHGQGLGTTAVKIVPRLMAYSGSRAYVYFLPTVAWKGKIRMGQREYNATLSQSQIITGRFDQPYTGLLLTPVGATGPRRSWYGDSFLGALRWVDGTLYQISASPSGDQLTVGPYSGESGLIRVDAGGRDIDKDKLAVRGLLMSKQRTLPLGDISSPIAGEKSQEYTVPSGEYSATYLTVDFGRLEVSLAQNRYALDDAGEPQPKSPDYGIKIQQDKPFLLNFSGKPQVIFTSPTKTQSCRVGQTLRLSALIVDPKLDLLVRGLNDTTKKVGERKYRDSDGKEVTAPRYASLDPAVVITNSAGEKVAEGTMPFG